MTSSVTDAPRGAASPPKTSVGRVIGALAALVIGAVLMSAAVSLAIAGGIALWAAGQAGPDGYFQTPSVAVNTTTYALVSPPIDLTGNNASNANGQDFMRENGMGDMGDMGYFGDNGPVSFNVGSLRVSAESAEAGVPLFIGVAPSAQVNAYLADVSHAVVTRANPGPAGNSVSVISGTRAPALPAEQDFWTLSATGTGEQNLIWNLQDVAVEASAPFPVSYTLVVMNADASQSVNVDLRGGARSDLIAPLGWGLLIGGLALLLVAVVLLVLGIVLLVRQPPRRTAGPDAASTDSVYL